MMSNVHSETQTRTFYWCRLSSWDDDVVWTKVYGKFNNKACALFSFHKLINSKQTADDDDDDRHRVLHSRRHIQPFRKEQWKIISAKRKLEGRSFHSQLLMIATFSQKHTQHVSRFPVASSSFVVARITKFRAASIFGHFSHEIQERSLLSSPAYSSYS